MGVFDELAAQAFHVEIRVDFLTMIISMVPYAFIFCCEVGGLDLHDLLNRWEILECNGPPMVTGLQSLV